MATGDEIVLAVINERRALRGALLPVLHGIQDRLGYIPSEAVATIARELNLSRAEVHGVITFYHHFREEPAGRTVIQICRAEACQANGADALVEHARAHLGCALHETTGDGAITLEPVFCLGQCAVGPALMLGERLYGRVTPARFDELVGRLGEPLA